MMTELKNQIDALKNGRTMKELKAADTKAYYKVKSLSDKLGWEKARAKGNFISKDDLVEFKGLIIWLLKRKCNFRGLMNLKKSMQMILDKVDQEQIVYKTKAGRKGIIADLTIRTGLKQVEQAIEEKYCVDTLDSYSSPIMQDFSRFELAAKK